MCIKKRFCRIPTSILGNSITDKAMKAVLVELFAKANYNNVDDGKRIIYRGQLKSTYDDLCSCTGLSKKVVRNRIEQLCRSGMITKEGTNRFLVITIINYDDYFEAKDTHRNVASSAISNSCSISSERKGNQEADNKAHKTICYSDSSSDVSLRKDTQNGIPLIYNKNKEIVVKRDNSKNFSSELSKLDHQSHFVGIEEKRIEFKKAVATYIKEFTDWEKYLGIPEFESALRNYAFHYTTVEDNGRLRYENRPGFSIDESLRRWLSQEVALKGKIQIN